MATDSTLTVVPPPTLVMAPMTVSHGEKPEKFNGGRFQEVATKDVVLLDHSKFGPFPLRGCSRIEGK